MTTHPLEVPRHLHECLQNDDTSLHHSHQACQRNEWKRHMPLLSWSLTSWHMVYPLLFFPGKYCSFSQDPGMKKTSEAELWLISWTELLYKGHRCLTNNNVCFTCVFPLLVEFSGDLLRSNLMGGKKSWPKYPKTKRILNLKRNVVFWSQQTFL